MSDPILPGGEAGLRDDLAAWLMAHDESCVTEDPAYYVEHFHDFLHGFRASLHSGDCTKESHACTRCLCDAYLKRADALLAGPLASLQADRTRLQQELDAVDLAFEGLEETDRARRIGHWIGLAAAETTRANAAEADRTRLEAENAALQTELSGERLMRITAQASAEHWEHRYEDLCNGPNG